jgi:hypothetical protein
VRFRQKEKLKIPKRSYSELFQSPEVKEKRRVKIVRTHTLGFHCVAKNIEE